MHVSQAKTPTMESSRPPSPTPTPPSSSPPPRRRARQTSVSSPTTAPSRQPQRPSSPSPASRIHQTKWSGPGRTAHLTEHPPLTRNHNTTRSHPPHHLHHTPTCSLQQQTCVAVPTTCLPPTFHQASTHSQEPLLPRRHAPADPAKSSPWLPVSVASSKNTPTTTASPPRTPCGFASSASTRTSGAAHHRL